MRIRTLVLGIGMGLFAAGASAQNVTWDFDKEADFSRYTTYAWVRGTPVQDELNDKRVVSAIETQLTAKGLRPAEAGSRPDVLIAYHANFTRDLQVNANSSDFGPRWMGSNRTGTARVEQLITGTLLVELFDVQRESVVWRGIATREVDVNANPDKRTKNINRAAEKLFKHYPTAK